MVSRQDCSPYVGLRTYGGSMGNDLNEINTGAWKNIQTRFHNFKVIADLGMRFTTNESKNRKRFVSVECVLCGSKYDGAYALFVVRDKVCKCESQKGKGKRSWSNPDRDRIIHIRNGMIRRCYNTNSKSFSNYGSRGIFVCDEWLNDSESFVEWSINNGYRQDLTIDRIDNNKGYTPDNCRWITRTQQCRNKRNAFTEDEVRYIRQLLNNGHKMAEVATMMNCRLNRIARISCRMTYKDVMVEETCHAD